MNSSFTPKKYSWILLFLFLTSCQTFKTRDARKTPQAPPKATPGVPQVPQVPVIPSEDQEITTEAPIPPPPAPVIPTMPKIGIILGGGGAKTFAHVGFLHEIQRAKIPVHAITGVEFAAPIAALYANKEQANDVEWQMFKLKGEDLLKKSLLGNVTKNNDVTLLKEFVNSIFTGVKIGDFRIPFACPSYNLKKNQVYLMNRGSLEQVMYSCMAYPPFFKPFQGNVSAVRDITATANYLRSKGANYVVFVNVLQTPGSGKAFAVEQDSTDNILWSEIAGAYNSKSILGIDSVISLDTGNYGIMDFDKRREIMAKGSESAGRQLKNLARKLGL